MGSFCSISIARNFTMTTSPFRVSLGIVVSMLTWDAWAEDPEKTSFVQTVPGMVFVGEVLALVNAGMATLDPQVYGIAGALLFPVAAVEGSASPPTRWVSLGAAEGLAVYNIAALDTDEDSDKKIFLGNMVAWHAFAAVVFITASLAGDLEDKKEVAVQYQPLRDGGMLRVAYAF